MTRPKGLTSEAHEIFMNQIKQQISLGIADRLLCFSGTTVRRGSEKPVALLLSLMLTTRQFTDHRIIVTTYIAYIVPKKTSRFRDELSGEMDQSLSPVKFLRNFR